MPLNRKDMEARYRLFDHFALSDQRTYYKRKTDDFRTSRLQVNRWRAGSSLATVVTTSMTAVLAPQAFNDACIASGECFQLQLVVGLLAALSIIFPAIGGFFGALLSLYQWDKFVHIYSSADENLEVADAHMNNIETIPDDERFIGSYLAYTEGTLDVMASETAQWGQTVKTPAQIEAFIERQASLAAKSSRGITGEGGKQFENPDGSFG